MDEIVLEEAPCNICGGRSVESLFESRAGHRQVEAYLPTTDSFSRYGHVVRCPACRVSRMSPRPSEEFLLGSYRESTDPLYLEEEKGRLKTARRLLDVVAKAAPSGRLLDLGCGAGILLKAAEGRWEGVGMELSRWAAEQARGRFGLNVVEGTLKEARFPSSFFNAVTMIDVIEHLPDPRDVVREAHRVLAPSGVIFVLTPDMGAVLARLMGRWWWGLRPAHLYYFSRSTLIALLEASGFKVISAGYYGREFSLGYWISRLGGYAPGIMRAAARFSEATGVGRVGVYLNTFDSVGILAVKRV